jgi:UDP-glucuronate 4-epimerase
MLAYTYAHLFGMAAICLRFFTVYGPRQRPDLAIHKFTSLIESGRPVPVFGDGNMGRDYTYVDDIVAGIQAAMAFDPQPSESTRFEIFNLGNSHPVTLNHLLEVLEKVIGKPVIREQHPLQMGDVPLTWADISKSARMLGYRPRTSLEQGLTNFVRWYRDTNGIPVEVSKAA